MLIITGLTVKVESKIVINNLTLTVAAGSIHAIMGPNGSGKSSLAAVIAGHPSYEVVEGTITFGGIDILALSPDKRAKLGIFLAFQQPPAISVRVFTFLHEAYGAIQNRAVSVTEFQGLLNGYLQQLDMDAGFIYRNLNEGFSGGERKRLELLQLLVLKPKLVILDEIDSGLDIDALRLVASVISRLHATDSFVSIVIITHYQRILHYLVPDRVHVLCDGVISDSGNATLVNRLEQQGYVDYRHAKEPSKET